MNVLFVGIREKGRESVRENSVQRERKCERMREKGIIDVYNLWYIYIYIINPLNYYNSIKYTDTISVNYSNRKETHFSSLAFWKHAHIENIYTNTWILRR